MAELNVSSKSTDKKNLHKLIRVDLTPMVDLGFLLITFFILTTSLQAATVMKLTLPKDSEQKTTLAESTTLTFILEGNDSIGYYDGLSKVTSYASFGTMRKIIQEKQMSLVNRNINKNKVTIIIRPTSTCTYKNFIDALDEVTINDCKHYFVVEQEQ